MRLTAIIAAGGIGSRLKTGGSKQLLELAGQPVLARTAAIFEHHLAVNEIIIAIEPADIDRCRAEVVERFGLQKVTAIVPGGDSRARSVKNALESVSPDTDTVLIHDGARPLFPTELLADGLAALENADGVVFALPVTDTIKETAADNVITATPTRERLWAAQTPQIFHREILASAFAVSDEALSAATDDASLVERAGGRVKIVRGSEENIKITRPLDLLVAEAIIRRRSS